MKTLKLMAALVAVVLTIACATAGGRQPDVAVAQVGTGVLQAATVLQNEVNRLTAAGTLPVAIGQKITDANKIIFDKSADLSTALKGYHAATTPLEKQGAAALVQNLLGQLSDPLAKMLGVQLPAGTAQSLSRLIGNVMSVVGAIQSEVAKGLGGLEPAFAS